MREIKFRVWNVKGMYFEYDPIILNGRVCFIDTFDSLEYYEDESMILQQYTGLKDKNGNEIYEGDITKDEFDRVACITWKENEARFAMRYVGQKTEYRMFISHLRMGVIGNIYENPELLEDTHE